MKFWLKLVWILRLEVAFGGGTKLLPSSYQVATKFVPTFSWVFLTFLLIRNFAFGIDYGVVLEEGRVIEKMEDGGFDFFF